MKAYFLSSNFTEDGYPRTPTECASEDFVNLIKGKIKEARFAPRRVPFCGQYVSFTSREEVLAILGTWGADILRKEHLTDAVLVPMPSSQTTQSHIPTPWPPLDMARAIKEALPTVAIWPQMRLIHPMESWRKTGIRDEVELSNNMHLTGAVNTERTHVLVDDAFTSGGHARVATTLLANARGRIGIALFASRSNKHLSVRFPDPFKIPPEDI